MTPKFIDPDWDKEYDEVNEIGDEEKEFPDYDDFLEGYRDDLIDKSMEEDFDDYNELIDWEEEGQYRDLIGY